MRTIDARRPAHRVAGQRCSAAGRSNIAKRFRGLDGLAVADFWAALIGSLIYSLCGMVIDLVIERLFPQE